MAAKNESHSEPDKFRELVLYVARETQDDPKCGATKLNKILFYTDFYAYRDLGASLSGQRYQKLEHGPAPRGIVPVIEAMRETGECAWQLRSRFGYELRKLVPLREPDLSLFSGREIDLVQRVISELWDLSATEVSDLSHRFVGWQVAEYGEDIAYDTVFVGEPRPLTPDEARWAEEVIDRYEAGTAPPADA